MYWTIITLRTYLSMTDMIWCYIISCFFMRCNMKWAYSYHVMWSVVMWCNVMWYDMDLYYMICYDMIWYDMMWYDMIWYVIMSCFFMRCNLKWSCSYHVIWCDEMWCNVIPYDIDLYNMIRNDLIRYDMIW